MVVMVGEGEEMGGGMSAEEEAEAPRPAPTLPIILPHREVVGVEA